MTELTREEALLVLRGKLEIMDMIQTIMFMSEGDITAEDILKSVQDECEYCNNQFETPLVCMVSMPVNYEAEPEEEDNDESDWQVCSHI